MLRDRPEHFLICILKRKTPLSLLYGVIMHDRSLEKSMSIYSLP